MRYRFQHREQIYEVSIEREGSKYLAEVDGLPLEFELIDSQPGILILRTGGQTLTLYWARQASEQWISLNGCTYRLDRPASRRASSRGEDSLGESVRAPMPAQVRAVQIAEGELVEKGQTLMLLEAMKMEIQVKAPLDGRILRLLARDGQSVDKDQLLVEIGE